jgi:DNA polymerase/3'-5' exonuclease PolX
MNKIIITEFEKLVNFISEEIDKLQNLKDLKKVTSNQFRLRQIKNVLSILKKFPVKITIDNYMELKNIQGIGKGSLDRIKEILETDKLSEIGNFIDTSKEKNKIIEDLETVVGIGHVNALEFFNQGVKSVKDLIKKIDKGKIEVNDKIQLGLKYYGKFQGNIPRKEIDKVNKIFNSIINKINKKLKDKDQYIYEICGSYRREKDTSGDIDILISKKGILDPEFNYLDNIIKLLKEPIKKNNDNPLLIDDMTDKNIHTKYMGFCKYKENPPRRIDIRFIPYDSYFSALLYFTGSVELNKQMRNIAKTKKLKLSEYGLFKENGDKIEINSERDVFDALNMEYLIPRLR